MAFIFRLVANNFPNEESTEKPLLMIADKTVSKKAKGKLTPAGKRNLHEPIGFNFCLDKRIGTQR